jgi:hypothetical protein
MFVAPYWRVNMSLSVEEKVKQIVVNQLGVEALTLLISSS